MVNSSSNQQSSIGVRQFIRGFSGGLGVRRLTIDDFGFLNGKRKTGAGCPWDGLERDVPATGWPGRGGSLVWRPGTACPRDGLGLQVPATGGWLILQIHKRQPG